MVIQKRKRCKVSIEKTDNGPFYLIISERDGFHCQVAELTHKQASRLAEYIDKETGL